MKKPDKIISSILLGLIFNFIMTSCTDMSENVYNKLENDQFFQSQDDVIRAIAPLYAGLRPLLDWQQGWDMTETSDVAVTPTRGNHWYDGGIYQRLSKHRWDAYDPHFESQWETLYGDITNSNRILFQIENAKFEIPNKKLYLAEVRAFRAYLYYKLWNWWGNVPIVEKFDVPEDFLPATNTQKEVYNFIINELKESIPDLSEQEGKDYYGRFNKWSALAILNRMYLNADARIGTPEWDKVISVSDSIINSNKFMLEPDFKTNFALDNHKSREIIFAWPFDENQTPDSRIYMAYSKTLHNEHFKEAYNAQYSANNGVQAVPTFVNTFDTTDIRYDATFAMGQQYSVSGDSLFNTGLVAADAGKPLDYTNTLSSLENAHESEGFRFNKFEIKMGAKFAPVNDWPAIRYAEILFMKAEAELRKGNISVAKDLVNRVRARAFDPDKPISANELSATINVDGVPVKYGRMLKEWGWEFAGETLRRAQQIRFGNFTDGIWSGHPQADDGNYRKLFPIPANKITSNPNLQQNPGY